MSLELELTFSLDRPGKPEKTVATYQLPPDVTGEQVFRHYHKNSLFYERNYF
jgi:hypothetical protein|nr:MAG TPA: hypothetical protein [Caudoviricetes sp.]